MLISFLIFHKPPFFSTSSHTIWWNHYSSFFCLYNPWFFTVCFSSHFNPIQDGLFRGSLRIGRTKDPPPRPRKICHTYHTMIKLGTVIPYLKKIKNIWITVHTHWVPLTSAFFHRKSANFAISRNTCIDYILIQNL